MNVCRTVADINARSTVLADDCWRTRFTDHRLVSRGYSLTTTKVLSCQATCSHCCSKAHHFIIILTPSHGRRPTQKVGEAWTKYKQNANLGNLYCSYKNLHQANTVVSQHLNTYRTFTSNTDWNMTHNLHFKKRGTCPPVHPVIDAHALRTYNPAGV